MFGVPSGQNLMLGSVGHFWLSYLFFGGAFFVPVEGRRGIGSRLN
jgi:hypothetical protein